MCSSSASIAKGTIPFSRKRKLGQSLKSTVCMRRLQFTYCLTPAKSLLCSYLSDRDDFASPPKRDRKKGGPRRLSGPWGLSRFSCYGDCPDFRASENGTVPFPAFFTGQTIQCPRQFRTFRPCRHCGLREMKPLQKRCVSRKPHSFRRS
jgi:hypothetical protein